MVDARVTSIEVIKQILEKDPRVFKAVVIQADAELWVQMFNGSSFGLKHITEATASKKT